MFDLRPRLKSLLSLNDDTIDELLKAVPKEKRHLLHIAYCATKKRFEDEDYPTLKDRRKFFKKYYKGLLP